MKSNTKIFDNISLKNDLHTDRGKLLLACCRSGFRFTAKVVCEMEKKLVKENPHDDFTFLQKIDRTFPDSETCAELTEHVSGFDAFLFQSLYNPVSGPEIDKNYMAFLIALRTLREHGARYITGVLPYLAYARQDKPTPFKREPCTAALMADLTVAAGLDRLVTWHPHCGQLGGFYGTVPVDMLDPLQLLVEEFREYKGRDDVVAVAPDAGAYRLAAQFSRTLEISSAVAAKYRSGADVGVSGIAGDFKGKKTAIILDDILSSGSTVHEVITHIHAVSEIDEVVLAVSHNLCSKDALARLHELHRNYHLTRVIVTNSIPQSREFTTLPFLEVRSLAHAFFQAVYRIHTNQSLSNYFTKDLN